ncbi:lytic transglycosylase domain-containing protein [Caulobacter sp. DWR1-3-2b1]|uniref:lytic transglycosylase domain-containing protein n=1 Tax=Caulobacter sp. DWR1-3-2b1 TaxID=2804670 RepID=UPI003CF8C233
MTSASASQCLSQVLEIADDGAVITYAAPTRFYQDGASPIASSSQSAVAESAPTSARDGAPDIARLIAAAASRHAVSADLITEVARRESGFRQTAVSNRDAVGVMQLTQGAAREVGVDRHDIGQNIDGGAAYLRRMLDRYGGDVSLALAAYNAGPGAVDRYRGVPPYRETTAYVSAILTRLAQRALADTSSLLVNR